jgi:hypothetical protein
LRFYSFLCKLSDKLKNTVDDLAALDAATALQRINDIDWRQPAGLMLPPSAGPSGEAATEEPEYMDVEELVGGGCGQSESDSRMSESDSEWQGDEKKQRTEAREMPVPLKEGGIYCHLHGLLRDPDWWQPYAGVQ